jgi:hypothetical protein
MTGVCQKAVGDHHRRVELVLRLKMSALAILSQPRERSVGRISEHDLSTCINPLFAEIASG